MALAKHTGTARPGRLDVGKMRVPVAGKSATYPVAVSAELVAELSRRVKAAGVDKVAEKAGMGRATIYRMIGDAPTVDGVEKLRRALELVEKRGTDPLPPPVVVVRSALHWQWIHLADGVSDAELERMIAAARPLRRK